MYLFTSFIYIIIIIYLHYFFPRGDEELDTLIRATIAGGGVIPHIHKSLIGKKEQSQKSS